MEFEIIKERPAAVATIYELLLLLFNEKWCRNKQQYIYFDLNRMALENISQKHNSRHAFNAQFTAIGHAHISKMISPYGRTTVERGYGSQQFEIIYSRINMHTRASGVNSNAICASAALGTSILNAIII